MKLLGSNSNAFDAWLLHNGLKTLAVRMDKHCDNAFKLATFLSEHKHIGKVNYPGLTTHPQYHLALSQMKKFGAMLSFELNGAWNNGWVNKGFCRY